MRFNREKFRSDLEDRLRRNYGKDIRQASRHDLYDAVSASVMEVIMPIWMQSRRLADDKPTKKLYYFSAEYLMGRALGNNLINMGIKDAVVGVLNEMDADYNLIEDKEPDAGLGNGGLGRLAACFLDSLATLDYPGHGYGIRYEYGMFTQKIEDGKQVEYPDDWLRHRDPWEQKRSDLAVTVKFGGNIRYDRMPDGSSKFNIVDTEDITATPYDMPIVGFGTDTVNTLRLWQASSPNGFDLQLFNNMEYQRAVAKQNAAQDISRVLYPNDSGPSGKTLRLKQQYFFTSASLQDMVHHFVSYFGTDFAKFPLYNVVQLNDTHPVVAIPEMMRILMDDYGLGWDEAWDIVTKTFAYTNHTILAEALEKWPVSIFQSLLPRVYQIVEEINRRFLVSLRAKYPDDFEKHTRMSIISSGKIHMAHLAITSCFSVNGVAALHTKILCDSELKDWYALYPEKFNNKTNGVTPRRWVALSNPLLADFITRYCGAGWERDWEKVRKLEEYKDNPEVLNELMSIKSRNKSSLALHLKRSQNEFLDDSTLFDVQVKRLHEYKRQLLNILHIMHLYNRILDGHDITPRTFIFGAKAASGYRRAKSIISLINAVATRINCDRRVGGRLRVCFVENYCVSTAQRIFPASDLSEQISTAGKEASGTGNMKFQMNGALTLGTMDGANVEIAAEVGSDNIFIFGLSREEISKMESEHSYNPQSYVASCPELSRGVEQLIDGTYDPTRQEFKELYDSLLYGVEGSRADVYYVLADFKSYVEAQERVAAAYKDKMKWARMCLLNIARSAKFSSDRTIRDYVRDIWHLTPVLS